ALTLDVWLEGLFSDRIGSVLRNSLATAEAYEQEHRDTLQSETLAMAADVRREAQRGISGAQLNALIAQQAKLRNLHQAYVFNTEKAIIARGEFSYLFNFDPPTDEDLARAQQSGEVVLIADPAGDEIRALVFLGNIGAYLYVSRYAQGAVLRLLDQTSQTVEFYDNLEVTRRDLMFEWAAWYMAVALVVVMTSIIAGFWFAERLAKPVGRLAGAAEQVGAGDLDVRVKEERGSDEIAVLSRVFNRMTGQLKGQRDALIEARDDTERRRLFIEAVLSGVTAGVIGLDSDGRIDLINDAAEDMLGLPSGTPHGRALHAIAPGLHGLLEEARAAPSGIARGEFRQVVRGQDREFLARVAPKSPDDPAEGDVLTFDDMTALASAQRVAAWGDVARRIAHEIKNPLTPIQLSADRLRRKFSDKLGEEGDKFDQLLDVITRQAGDIRRMVDEFSKFARMPEPALDEQDLTALVSETVLLQREARAGITYREHLPNEPVLLSLDRGLMGQVLTNLLQNAADAIDARIERDGPDAPAPAINVGLEEGNRAWRLTIADNGIGLPAENRDRLTDPYVTNRVKGTGLGLAIVKKIVEQHGGELLLANADPALEGEEGLDGARITVRLPKPAGREVTSSKGAETGAKTGEAA
ncbi:MAG: ATP-binding protein, partial [Pseudomonadota bacterium]